MVHFWFNNTMTAPTIMTTTIMPAVELRTYMSVLDPRGAGDGVEVRCSGLSPVFDKQLRKNSLRKPRIQIK